MSRLLLSLTLSAALAAPAAAQGPCGASGPHLPAAGGWSQYQTARGTMKMAYLGHEANGDRIEMQMTTDRGNMIMQVVTDGFPYDPSGIHEAVLKMGERPAMKMPEMMLQRMGNNGGFSKDMCADLTKVGEETVTVPAGTFKTTHYHFKSDRNVNGMQISSEGDVWVNPDVPFGMVKESGKTSGMRGEQEMTMVLTATGKDAKSSITETPQEMGPGMMMGPPRGGRSN
jgi:hypothetical protein